jgi:hypothetical protein
VQPSSSGSRKRIGIAAAQPMIKPADPALAAQLAAEVRAAVASGGPVHDCGSKHLPHVHDGPSVGIASVNARGMAGPRRMTLLEAEQQMLDCQAKDTGPPAETIKIPIYWTAGKVCKGRKRSNNGGRCTGGEYPSALVEQQIAYVNSLYAHAGIQFIWDGVIHHATANSVKDVNVCLDPYGQCWACGLKRHGDQVAINIVTSPVHLG